MSRLFSVLIVFIVLVLLCTATWSGKIAAGSIDHEVSELVFNGQETLKYEISWSGGIKIGDLLIEIRKTPETTNEYLIHARVKDSGLFHFFYPVNDTFDTKVTGSDRLPVSYHVEQKEGSSYHAIRHTAYDQENGIVHYKKNDNKPEIFDVIGDVHNEFSSFFYTRILKLDKNNPVVVPTFADKKRHEVVVQTGETVKIKNEFLGELQVLPVRPLMDFKGLYDKSGDTVIYLTDDLCRVPVRINSKILIGSITAELVSFSSSTCVKYSSQGADTPSKP
jgi:hypothetical protein